MAGTINDEMVRIRLSLALFTLGFLAVVARLFYWQVLAKDELRAVAEKQYQQVVTIASSRGEILASDSSPLVANQTAWLVYAEPGKLTEKPEVMAEKLAAVILKNKFDNQEDLADYQKNLKDLTGDLTGKLSDKNLAWVALVRKVENQGKAEIENLKFSGIGFFPNEKRFYPEGTTAAHLLGFVGSDKFGTDTGYFGLEGYYNSQLQPRTGKILAAKDAIGNLILTPQTLEIAPVAGKTLVTTIDRNVQFIAQKAIEQGVAKYGAKSGSVTILNPKTGEVLAMATYPAYNPENLGSAAQDDFKNPIVADNFEPGSIFKIVGAAAALDEEIVKPDSICDKCTGPREIAGFTIRTWNNKYYQD